MCAQGRDERPGGAEERGAGRAVVVDLDALAAPAAEDAAGEGGDGAVWSLPHGGDLDANLVRLGAGAEIGEHRNDEVDVLVSVLAGDGELVVDGAVHGLAAGRLALVPRGARRSVRAGDGGLRYLSVHRRRGPLAIGPRRR